MRGTIIAVRIVAVLMLAVALPVSLAGPFSPGVGADEREERPARGERPSRAPSEATDDAPPADEPLAETDSPPADPPPAEEEPDVPDEPADEPPPPADDSETTNEGDAGDGEPGDGEADGEPPAEPAPDSGGATEPGAEGTPAEGEPAPGDETGDTPADNATPAGEPPADEPPIGQSTPTADEAGDAAGDETDEPPGDEVEAQASPIASPEPEADGGTGTLIITKIDGETDEVLEGACFQVLTDVGFSPAGCDADDDRDGQTVIADLPEGEHTLRETVAPIGYVVGFEVEFSIVAGEDTELTVPNEAGGATLTVNKVDENGDPLGGACFAVFEDDGGSFGQFLTSNCDGPSNDGVILIPGLPPGDYWLSESTVPDGYVRAAARQFSLEIANLDDELTVENERAGGDLVIAKVDQNGDSLGGACFVASNQTGSGFACDGQDGDDDGRIVIAGLRPGSYTLFETFVPPGYVGGAQRTVQIVFDEETEVTVENTIGGQLIVSKVDENGDPLPGTCFNVNEQGGGGFVAFSCDTFDGDNDGTIHFANLPTGDFTLGENFVPPGYAYSPPVDFSVAAGETTSLTFDNQPGGQTVFVLKTDTEGNALTGACFEVRLDLGGGEQGEARAGGCDSFDGDDDGTVTLAGLSPGDYVLVETFAPFGYAIAAPVQFTIVDGQDAELTVEDEKLQPGQFGSLVIRKVDANGDLLTGACFELLNPQSGEPVTSQPHCDGGFGDADGVANGVKLFDKNVRGTFILRETTAPDGYVAGEDITVTIDAGETVTVDIVNLRESDEEPTDEGDDDDDVTALPNTGAGPFDHTGAPSLLLGALTLALLGALHARLAPRGRAR